MSIHLTPDILAAAYELLRATPPFRGWKLPHADEVAFHVVATDVLRGDHHCDAGTHVIRISAKNHQYLHSLIQTMAHEMCHMHEHKCKVRGDIHHGKEFKRRAKSVCKRHGFDYGSF